MTFPQFTDKHLHESLFTPEDYLKYRKIDINNLPKKNIIYLSSKIREIFY